MLVELRIRDYAVIDDLTLELGPGLNALTGETGAGKSIIVGALSLLLGERAYSDVVRAGAERAHVEAVFDVSAETEVTAQLEELGFRPDDGLMILRREVAAEGRNRAWVNGSPTTAGVVGDLGATLVDLHGQHEHQTLLRPAEQRRILDAYAGATPQADLVAKLHAELSGLRRELDDREERRREVESRADFLRFQLTEIDEASLDPNEDEALESEAGRHEHAEELVRGASEIYELLYGGEEAVSDRIAQARKILDRLAEFDAELKAQTDALADAAIRIDEVGRHMGDYAESVDHDPHRLSEIRSRLDLIFRLKRKYGPELADVLATAQRVRTELADLDDADHDVGVLRKRIETAGAELRAAAEALSAKRRAASDELASSITTSLPELGLAGATFEVRLAPHDAVGSGGAESVEYRVSTNQGFSPQALSKVASGGELSRVMLALKSALAGVDRVPVLVFDEIDAGVGGTVASAVALELARVAERHQVFVVTHLAQVASRAGTHLRVEKEHGRDVTAAHVTSLSGDDRVEEIARMLGGDPESETSRRHAQELLEA